MRHKTSWEDEEMLKKKENHFNSQFFFVVVVVGLLTIKLSARMRDNFTEENTLNIDIIDLALWA